MSETVQCPKCQTSVVAANAFIHSVVCKGPADKPEPSTGEDGFETFTTGEVQRRPPGPSMFEDRKPSRVEEVEYVDPAPKYSAAAYAPMPTRMDDFEPTTNPEDDAQSPDDQCRKDAEMALRMQREYDAEEVARQARQQVQQNEAPSASPPTPATPWWEANDDERLARQLHEEEVARVAVVRESHRPNYTYAPEDLATLRHATLRHRRQEPTRPGDRIAVGDRRAPVVVQEEGVAALIYGVYLSIRLLIVTVFTKILEWLDRRFA